MTQQEQAQLIREEWGHHAPNRSVVETSSEDHARTSHLAGRCRVEGQALVEQGSEVGDCHRREGLRVDRKRISAQFVQWACQTRLQQRWNTGNTRLRARQGCPAWTWTTRKNDRPIEEPNQRRNLGQMGEWETIPSGGQGFEIRRTTGVGTAEGENGRRTWHVVRDTERIECRILMGMSRCSKEAARRGSDRTGTRSCVQRSPQEWTDRARHS